MRDLAVVRRRLNQGVNRRKSDAKGSPCRYITLA